MSRNPRKQKLTDINEESDYLVGLGGTEMKESEIESVLDLSKRQRRNDGKSPNMHKLVQFQTMSNNYGSQSGTNPTFFGKKKQQPIFNQPTFYITTAPTQDSKSTIDLSSLTSSTGMTALVNNLDLQSQSSSNDTVVRQYSASEVSSNQPLITQSEIDKLRRDAIMERNRADQMERTFAAKSADLECKFTEILKSLENLKSQKNKPTNDISQSGESNMGAAVASAANCNFSATSNHTHNATTIVKKDMKCTAIVGIPLNFKLSKIIAISETEPLLQSLDDNLARKLILELIPIIGEGIAPMNGKIRLLQNTAQLLVSTIDGKPTLNELRKQINNKDTSLKENQTALKYAESVSGFNYFGSQSKSKVINNLWFRAQTNGEILFINQPTTNRLLRTAVLLQYIKTV